MLYSISKLMVSICLLVISEDMVNDGFEDIMNVDISSVAIEMMRKKYENVPQLKCILTICNASSFLNHTYKSVDHFLLFL